MVCWSFVYSDLDDAQVCSGRKGIEEVSLDGFVKGGWPSAGTDEKGFYRLLRLFGDRLECGHTVAGLRIERVAT